MVTPQAAEAVERAVNAGSSGTVEIDTEDGRIAIVVPRVMYLKRFTKGSQPGFAADWGYRAAARGSRRPRAAFSEPTLCATWHEIGAVTSRDPR